MAIQKLSKMAACRQLRFDVTRNSAIWSADPENPTLETNMKCIGWPVAEIWPFAYLGVIWNPYLGEGEVVEGSAMAPFDRAMVVSYRLSIVKVALSVTVRPQFAIECLRRSKQQGVVHFGPKFLGVPLGVNPLMFGSAESEHPRLTNCGIIFEEFQPMWSQSTNVTDRRTDGWTDGGMDRWIDGQTDGQTTCDRKTTLCTPVHCTVRTVGNTSVLCYGKRKEWLRPIWLSRIAQYNSICIKIDSWKSIEL